MAINAMIPMGVQVADPLNALAKGYQMGNTIRQQPMQDKLNQQKLEAGQVSIDSAKQKMMESAKDFRVKSAVMGAAELQNAPVEQWANILQDRIKGASRYGYDADVEKEALEILATKGPEALKAQVDGLVKFGSVSGILGGGNADLRQQEIDLRRQALEQNNEQFRQQFALRERELNRPSQQMTPSAVAEWEYYSKLTPEQRTQYDAMKRGTPGYSSTTEKQIFGASDAYVQDNAAAENYLDLARRYEDAQGKLASGVAGSLTEWLKEQTGSQDELSLLRKDWASIKASEVVKNLPPGAASDADIALALEGFLPTNANPQTVASFLRGVSKLRRLNAEYNAFKADYLSENKNPGGMRKAWQDRASQMGITGPTTSSSQFGGLQPGAVEDGYRFKGGNPADANNWEKI